ncbi:MAG TPA: amino acid adenylation domain-containing protein, partial [Ktedonobacteraceae bacterium]
MPLDPAFPAERMAYMLNDAQARLLLTQQSLLTRFSLLQQDGFQVLCLDEPRAYMDQEGEPDCGAMISSNLAYIMYTSGSTGKPKGVPISHQGFVNYLAWCQDAYGAASGYGAPMQSSIAADAIFPSLFAPLLVGTCVMLLPESYALEALREVLLQQPGFSMSKITPTQLEVLNLQLPAQPARNWVRTLVVGAEALRADVLEFWHEYVPETRILNEYGPTETVVGCSIYEVPANGQQSGAVPIGLPSANTQFYVLDAHMHPVPVGVVGELYIGGDGVARGYHNRPDLTAQVFVPDPFSSQPGRRLYKTGDLVRYLAEREANIEFVGRRDEQVKIRGYRVELGEVEAVLAEHEDIEQVVVVAREAQGEGRRGKDLVAYVVLRHPRKGVIEQLRAYLKERLPEYMQPAAFAQLEQLPLTATGKVDLRALPAPDRVGSEAREDFVEPRDILELQLVQIWENILQIHPISVTDNFFALGGHSFLAVGLMSQIQKRFNYKLPLSILFQKGNIESLANVLRKQNIAQMRSPVVAIQPRGSKLPFFCVHPAGGDILIYYNLAHHLGSDRPFYGLQDPGIYEEAVQYSSIEELAAFYIEALLTVQPEGSYMLGGYSFGGNVAFEMAQQLQKQGREVL